jgi:uncharacterized membrane protein YozB (DUF420 family)
MIAAAALPADIANLPALNASLNGACAVLLVLGIGFVSSGKVAAHKACMALALLCSTAFLACYAYYHVRLQLETGSGSVHYEGTGTMRLVYFAILISHVALAALVLPLALVTAARGLRGDIPRHRKIAKWTFPAWLYVNETGVVVFLMLYHGPGATS